MIPEELKAQLMAQAEAMIDKMLARKPKVEDITLSDIEQLAIGGGQDFREAVLKSLAGESSQSERGKPCAVLSAVRRCTTRGNEAKTG